MVAVGTGYLDIDGGDVAVVVVAGLVGTLEGMPLAGPLHILIAAQQQSHRPVEVVRRHRRAARVDNVRRFLFKISN